MTDTVTRTAEHESVDDFRRRARAWLGANLRPSTGGPSFYGGRKGMAIEEVVQHNRDLMRTLFDGGFSGICYPKAYGGQGLTMDHLRAFSEEAIAYELPWMFANPTLCILAPTILDCGSEEQKLRHLPAILRGDELWVQFLSEPTGGSDLAGVRTTATRDGDVLVVRGSKIWTSGADLADYALCVARTDWDAPKHSGISVLIMPVRAPGITIEPIRQVNGASGFCQEHLDDVAVPVADVLGAENDGWNVTQRMLQHEKLSLGGGSPYQLVLGAPGQSTKGEDPLVGLARDAGRADDPAARRLVAEGIVTGVVQDALVRRIVTGLSTGALPGPASALIKLMGSTTSILRDELAVAIAGPAVAAWETGSSGGKVGSGFLYRQAMGILGGTNEIQRNIISERVLGMPREWAADRGVPFKDVGRQQPVPAPPQPR